MANSAQIELEVVGGAAFKKELSSVTQQSKTLAAEMKATASAFDAEGNSEKKNAAVKEVLAKQIETQQRRIDLLKQAVEKYTETETESGSTTLKYRELLAKAEAAMNDMTRQAYELEHGVDTVGDEMEDAGKEALSFGDVLKANVISDAIRSGVEALAEGIKKVAGAMKDAIVDSAAFADNILTLSTNTGISTDTLQEFQYMAELTDTSVDTITGSMKKLITKMSAAKSGSGEAAETFAALGVSVTDANGELRDNEDVFMDVIDSLGRVSNETERDALSMAIFGKSAQDLNSLIAVGADGIAEFADEAHRMGYVLDKDTLGSLGGVDDALQRSKLLLESTKNQIGAGLAPTVESLAEKLTELVQSVDWTAISAGVTNFINFIITNGPTILSVLTGIGAAFATWKSAMIITQIIGFFSKFSSITEVLNAAQAALNSTMLANPFVLVATLIAGLVTAFVTLYKTNDEFRAKVDETWTAVKETVKNTVDNVISWFRNLWQNLQTTVGNIRTSVVNGFTSAFASVRDAVTNIASTIRNTISGLISSAIGWGSDMINGLAAGIRNAIGSVVGAVSSVAQTIASWIHFSKPDVGPLRDYEAWMPDMIQGMATGIRENAHVLEDALAGATKGMQVGVEGSAGASTTYMGGVQITVNAQDGQSAQEIANYVFDLLQHNVDKKGAAYA